MPSSILSTKLPTKHTMHFKTIIATLAFLALVNFGDAAVTSTEAKIEARLAQLDGVSVTCSYCVSTPSSPTDTLATATCAPARPRLKTLPLETAPARPAMPAEAFALNAAIVTVAAERGD